MPSACQRNSGIKFENKTSAKPQEKIDQYIYLKNDNCIFAGKSFGKFQMDFPKFV